MKVTQTFRFLTAIFLLTIHLFACSSSPESDASSATSTAGGTAVATTITSQTNESDEVARPDGWSEATHSNDVDPNYEVVFPEDEVLRLDITIDGAEWELMLANLTELLGEQGTGGFGGPGEGNLGSLPEGFEPPEGFSSPAEGPGGGGEQPGAGFGGPGGVPGDFTSENPMWAEATITFEQYLDARRRALQGQLVAVQRLV
ncbi:MAG: hypothetical protein IPM53_18810 [Anaerolineaceae bacterium]|nr:hypothetical protein [Anaerolineaceae bacterium]